MEIETIVTIILGTIIVVTLLSLGFALGSMAGCKCLIVVSTEIPQTYLEPIMLP